MDFGEMMPGMDGMPDDITGMIMQGMMGGEGMPDMGEMMMQGLGEMMPDMGELMAGLGELGEMDLSNVDMDDLLK